jgi:hypothetical protein
VTKRAPADPWGELRAQKPAVAYLLYFPALRDVAREHGYALAIHGSLGRDFDLVAIPWTDEASSAQTLVTAMCEANQLEVVHADPHGKPHGRLAWNFVGVGLPDRGWIDLSVMPRRRRRAKVSP